MTAATTSIRRAGSAMAVGTVLSRGTGFVRTAVMLWALGGGTTLANVYNITNVIPNVLYDLLLGGVLGGVLIPVLLQAAKDEDGGLAFTRSLLTIATLALGTLALLSMLTAPFIAHLYGFDGKEEATAVIFLRFFLPQILFYGLSALCNAILNARGQFAAPMVAPVATNIVTIATYLVFMALPGGTDARHLTTAQTFTLGFGTTFGIIAMWLAILPAMRRVGVTFKPTLELHHEGLRDAWRLSGFVLGYAAVNQLGYLIIVKLAKPSLSYTPYSVAYQVLQLPHAIIAVSIITAYAPRIATHGLEGRVRQAAFDVARGTRLLIALLTPAAVLMLILGPSASVFALAHGASTTASAELIGQTMIAFGAGLIPFSLFQLMLRSFYSLKDTRTPFLINIASTAINVVFDAVAVAEVPKGRVAVWLAVGLSVSYLCAALACGYVLARRLGGLRGPQVRRIMARCALAGAIAGIGGGLTSMVLTRLGVGETFWGSLLHCILGAAVVVVLYVRLTRRMQVHEVGSAVAPLRRLVPRRAGG